VHRVRTFAATSDGCSELIAVAALVVVGPQQLPRRDALSYQGLARALSSRVRVRFLDPVGVQVYLRRKHVASAWNHVITGVGKDRRRESSTGNSRSARVGRW